MELIKRRRLPVAALCLLIVGCAGPGSDDTAERSAAIEPSARRIVYTQFRPNGAPEVWIAHVDGTRKRRLARGREPAISPDGRWVAFHGGRCDLGYCPDLMLVAVSGGQPRLLMRGAEESTWSPDSTRLAAAQRLTALRRALVSIDVVTGKTATLARGAIYGWSFSPTGDAIAYARADPDPWGLFREDVDIYVSDPDGGSKRRLSRDGDSAYPVWGPRDIAFARIVPRGGWGAHEIWLVHPDGSQARRLTKTPAKLLGQGIVGLVPVAWSASGDALLSGLHNEFGAVPYGVDPKSGGVHAIGDYGYHAWPDGLSRDGRFALVSDGGVEVTEQTRVEIVPFTGGPGRVIARRAFGASWNK